MFNAAYTALSCSIRVERLRETLKPYFLTSAWSLARVHSSKSGVEGIPVEALAELVLGRVEGPASALVEYAEEPMDEDVGWARGPLSLLERRDIVIVGYRNGRGRDEGRMQGRWERCARPDRRMARGLGCIIRSQSLRRSVKVKRSHVIR